MERNFIKYRKKGVSWGLTEEIVDGLIRDALENLKREQADPTPLNLPSYYKDWRKPNQYYFDIVEGWLVEDLLLEWFKIHDRGIVRGGSDLDRRIQRNSTRLITTRIDLLEIYPDATLKPIEVQMSREKRDVYHVKKGKGERLVREDGVLMFLIIPDDEFFMVTPDDILNSELKPNPGWGGKNCYWIKPYKYHKMGD